MKVAFATKKWAKTSRIHGTRQVGANVGKVFKESVNITDIHACSPH